MSRIESTSPAALVAAAPVRVDRRTKDLAKRLRPGEIAVIAHQDLDRVAAESLVAAGAGAVVNAAESISGRYPNAGPLHVVTAGIPLVDQVDPAIMDELSDGDVVRIEDGDILRDGQRLAGGVLLSVDDVTERMEVARTAIGSELQAFAENTLEYVQTEAHEIFQPLELPSLETRFQGRHSLIVVRGHDYRQDLRALRPYIHEYHPVLIAVDGGADALLELRLKPDIIIGDFDSLSERAWHCGAELVHHVHPDGRAPGRENLLEKGLPYHEFVVEGTSEDAAMLLAYENRTQLIVAVGTHATMVEFLDKGRAGMSSTFLTRLRIGPMLVDAKGVNQLYQGRVRRRDLLFLMAAALIVILAVVVASESLQTMLRSIWLDIRELWYSLTGRF